MAAALQWPLHLRRSLATRRSLARCRNTMATATSTAAAAAASASASASAPANFGSFHSGDVEALVRAPLSSFPPADASLPRTRAALLPSGPLPSLPLPERRALFLLDLGGWTFVNHGAFGATLRAAHALAADWRAYQERQPLRFFDRVLLPELARRLHLLAALLRAEADALVFVANATAGLNVAVRAMAAQAAGRGNDGGGDALLLDLAYGSVKTMVAEAVAATTGGRVETVAVPLPLQDGAQGIVARVAAALDARAAAGKAMPAMAVFDHVTSNTGLVLPVEALARLCAARGIPVLVDGAHGPLQLDVDLGRLREAGVTYYAANAHKWLASEKSVGILWGCSAEARARLRPLNISHGYGHGFTSDFLWDGCRDYSAMLALPACLDVWEACGGVDVVRQHTHALLRQAAEMLAAEWHTGFLAPLEMHANMALVAVPARHGPGDGKAAVYADAAALQTALFRQNIEVPVKALGGRLYVRISAHIYNTMEDYQQLARALA